MARRPKTDDSAATEADAAPASPLDDKSPADAYQLGKEAGRIEEKIKRLTRDGDPKADLVRLNARLDELEPERVQKRQAKDEARRKAHAVATGREAPEAAQSE